MSDSVTSAFTEIENSSGIFGLSNKILILGLIILIFIFLNNALIFLLYKKLRKNTAFYLKK